MQFASLARLRPILHRPNLFQLFPRRSLNIVKELAPRPQHASQTEGAWGLRLNHENVYLSWSRNAVISTVAGTALYQQVPVVAGGLFLMGFSFQLVGTAHYLTQAFALHRVIGLSTRVVAWYTFHSLSACLVWTFTIGYYLLEKRPEWFDSVLDLFDDLFKDSEIMDVDDEALDVSQSLRNIRRDLMAELHHLEMQREQQWFGFLFAPSTREMSIRQDLVVIDEMLAMEVYALRDGAHSVGLSLREILIKKKRNLEKAAKYKHHHSNSKKIFGAISDLNRCQQYMDEIEGIEPPPEVVPDESNQQQEYGGIEIGGQ